MYRLLEQGSCQRERPPLPAYAPACVAFSMAFHSAFCEMRIIAWAMIAIKIKFFGSALARVRNGVFLVALAGLPGIVPAKLDKVLERGPVRYDLQWIGRRALACKHLFAMAVLHKHKPAQVAPYGEIAQGGLASSRPEGLPGQGSQEESLCRQRQVKP